MKIWKDILFILFMFCWQPYFIEQITELISCQVLTILQYENVTVCYIYTSKIISDTKLCSTYVRCYKKGLSSISLQDRVLLYSIERSSSYYNDYIHCMSIC